MFPGDPEPLYFDVLVVVLGLLLVILGVFLWRNPGRGVEYIRWPASVLFGRSRAQRGFPTDAVRWGFALWVPMGVVLIIAGVARIIYLAAR